MEMFAQVRVIGLDRVSFERSRLLEEQFMLETMIKSGDLGSYLLPLSVLTQVCWCSFGGNMTETGVTTTQVLQPSLAKQLMLQVRVEAATTVNSRTKRLGCPPV